MKAEVNQYVKAVNIWNRLQKVHQILSREIQKEFSDKGITSSQFVVLMELNKHKELPMWKIGDLLSVTGGNVTGLIDRLEKKGLVIRERSKKDRRIIKAAITGSGEKMYNSVIGDFEKSLFCIMSDLEEPELESFGGMLTKLSDCLENKYSGEEKLSDLSLIEEAADFAKSRQSKTKDEMMLPS